MGKVGVGVANTLNDGNFSFVEELLERCHIGVPANFVINGYDLIFRNPDVGPIVVIQWVRIGNYGVHKIVTARQLQNYQDGIFLCASHVSS